MVKEIEKAINCSDIGINPTNDGKLIRLVFPELTEERRKDLAKDIKKKGEEAKVAVRNIRRDAIDSIKKTGKEEGISEDEIKASRMTLKSLPTSLSQKLTLRLTQNVKRYLLYSIYITYTNKGHVYSCPLFALFPVLLFTLNCVTSK